MRNKLIFALVVLGAALALFSAYVYAVPAKPLAPVFQPAPNPYADGIYANGIIESYQPNGANMNLYPEVSGVVTRIFVSEGQSVSAGAPLFLLDDSVQRAVVEQQRAQADASLALLLQLKAQPRPENLSVAAAQVQLATANLKSAADQLAKLQHSLELAPESVSREVLDNAINGEKVAKANLDVVTKQYELTHAGAWVFDIKTQEKQHDALLKALGAASALLSKYTVVAPSSGIVLSIGASIGSYVSPQGAYDPYTQGYAPVVSMGTPNNELGVRCFIDEILISRLPAGADMHAVMSVRGTTTRIPLDFVRLQPHVSPKIQLSNQRTERVDLRVLPVIFKFKAPTDGMKLYPGELVDVYIGKKPDVLLGKR